MFLGPYLHHDGISVRISAEQGSRFAKQIARDFNPIHDADNPRFCVPGDLLFVMALSHYGLSQQMRCRFAGMVGADVALELPPPAEQIYIASGEGKPCLELERKGPTITDPALIESVARDYVEVSGRNFPDILVPLLTRHGVMLNADRPMVIYESTWLELDSIEVDELRLSLINSTLEVNGRRGEEQLHFRLESHGREVGRGAKCAILSGLKPLESGEMQRLIDRYAGWKAKHTSI